MWALTVLPSGVWPWSNKIMSRKLLAVYPGTFDPITLGHEDLLRRTARLFDGVIVAVAIAHHKKTLFSLDERMDMAREALRDLLSIQNRQISVENIQKTVADYYKIKVDDVVSSLGAAQIVDYCFRNILPQTCGAYNLNNPNGPNYINVQSFNLASIKTSGFDIEASYRWRQPLGLSGNFTLRALATHIREFWTDTGLPGTVPVDSAGVNQGNTPKWKWLAIQSYETDRFSIMLQERWFTDGNYGNQYVVCAREPARSRRQTLRRSTRTSCLARSIWTSAAPTPSART